MSRNAYYGNWLGFISSAILLTLLTFSILKWLQMPTGDFVDWLIGIGIFAWLVVIVTVPWNIHFEARAILLEATRAEQAQIDFDKGQLPYVQKTAQWALIAALVLHLVSAAGLYYLAYAKITALGYYGAGAALLLTLLRPSVRAYEYIAERLANIRQAINYPADNVATLQSEVEQLKYSVQDLLSKFDESVEDTWINQFKNYQLNVKDRLKAIEGLYDSLNSQNTKEHQRLADDTRNAVSQLSEDSKFLNHVVEIIRFIKKA